MSSRRSAISAARRKPWGVAILGVVLVAAVVAPSAEAHAQACCAGGASADRSSWVRDPKLSVGAELSARVIRWSDTGSRYRTLTGRERELRQVLFGAARFSDALRLQGSLPFVQTHRAVIGDEEWGGGVGDGLVVLRWRLRNPASDTPVPAVELEGRLTAPTGRSPPASVARGRRQWMTDVTGSGVWTPGVGLRLTRTFGEVYGEWAATLDWPTRRAVGETRFRPGPLLSSAVTAGAPVADVVAGGPVQLLVSGSLGFESRGRVHVDGERVDETSERRTSLAVVLGAQGSRWYGALRLGTDIPLQPITRRAVTGFIGSFTLRYDLPGHASLERAPPMVASTSGPSWGASTPADGTSHRARHAR